MADAFDPPVQWWKELKESIMPGPFNPAIKIIGERLQYEDGSVSAELDSFGPNLIVYSWSSSGQSQDESVRALQWLRAEGYHSITVKGFGLAGSSAPGPNTAIQAYWVEMQNQGHVDVLITDDHVYIGKQESEIYGEEEDDELLDEFSLHRGLAQASLNLDKMTEAMTMPMADSPARAAKRNLQAYRVLREFAAGNLKSQEISIESSEEMYGMLDSDPARWGAITRGIHALSKDRSFEASLELLRHIRWGGLVTFDMGWDSPLTFLYNPRTQQVLSASGVMDFSEIRKGREFQIVRYDTAHDLRAKRPVNRSTINDFGWIAALICEQQGLLLEPEDLDEGISP